MDRERETTPKDHVTVVEPGERPPERSSDGIVLGGGAGGRTQHFLDTAPPAALFYKTKLCVNYDTSGTCMFGADCAFAHGTVELRRPRVEDGRMCYNFMYKGTCYYGENCIFSHASAAPGLAIRNPWELMPVEARRSETTPSVTVRSETSSASGRAFPPAVHQVPQEQEAAGGRRISNLERLSRKKTTGIYGDWPEQF